MTLSGAWETLLEMGPALTRDVRRAGLSQYRLSQLLSQGELRGPLYGVVIRADLPDDLVNRALALALVLPSGAVACRGTAAWLYGIDTRAPGQQHVVPPVECVVPVGSCPVRRPGVKGYVAPLDAEDVMVRFMVPVTTPVRTALDVVRWSPPHVGLAAIDEMTHKGIVSPSELVAIASQPRWDGGPFIARARHLIAHCEPKTESPGESWTRLRLIDAGYPPPEAQIPFLDDADRELARLDLGYPTHHFGIEYDGVEFHSSHSDQQHDEERRIWLRREREWDVVPVGKGDVLGRSMKFEETVGGVLGLEPRFGRRLW